VSLVVAHPLTESIKLASKSINVDLVSSFRSVCINLLLFLPNLAHSLPPGHLIQQEVDDAEDGPEK